MWRLSERQNPRWGGRPTLCRVSFSDPALPPRLSGPWASSNLTSEPFEDLTDENAQSAYLYFIFSNDDNGNTVAIHLTYNFANMLIPGLDALPKLVARVSLNRLLQP